MSPTVDEQDIFARQADARRVLIVENDPDSRRTLQRTLAQSGFTVTILNRGEDALAAIDRDQPHLVMLDWEYPGTVAMSLIRHIQRDAPAQRPSLMALSLYSSEQQIVSGFDLGLDDYVVRPYSAPVVVARVRAILRSRQRKPEELDFLEFHRLRMDLNDLRVMIDDRIVSLRPTEFRLLAFLMHHPERVFTRQQILNHVWSRDSRADQRAVDVNVQRTRKALALCGCGGYLQTVRCFGYRLSAVER